jgi:hypothetical protein
MHRDVERPVSDTPSPTNIVGDGRRPGVVVSASASSFLTAGRPGE